MGDATNAPRPRGRGSTARTGVALLVGALIFLLAVGCAGGKETGENSRQTGKEEAKKERTGAGDTQSRGPQKATLEMSGSPGTGFSGSCAVGDQKSELDGQVPDRFVYDLDGKKIDCEIRKEDAEGNLQLTFTAGSTTSVQQIGQGAVNLTYDNGQVSFSSSDSGGQVSSSSSQVVPSSQSNSSSVTVSP